MKRKTQKPVATPDLSGLVEKTLRHGSKALVAFLMVLLVLQALPAKAGGGGGFAGATEATQIMNNAELAMQSVQEELQALELVEQTYLQRMQQLSSSIGQYTGPFAKAYGSYQKIKATQETLTAFKGKLENLDGALEERFRQLSVSNLSWQSYVDREGQMIRDGNQRAIAQMKANHDVLIGTRDSMQAYQSAADAMDATTGTHQATRMLGSQLTLLGGDLNRLIAITAQANSIKGLEIQERAAERESARASAEQVRKLQAALDKKRRAELEAVIQGGGK